MSKTHQSTKSLENLELAIDAIQVTDFVRNFNFLAMHWTKKSSTAIIEECRSFSQNLHEKLIFYMIWSSK